MATSSKPKRAKPVTGMWILLLSLFIAELLFYTWCRVQNVSVGYRIASEDRKHQALATLQNNLKVELARLKAPKRITQIATRQLGLQMPTPEQTVIIP